MTNFHNCKIVCKSSLTNLAIFMLVLGLCSFVHATPQQINLPEKSQPFLASYCFECHDSKTREGGVDLETLALEITTVEQAEKWQKVLNVLNSGEMPPEDYEQPDNVEKADFLDNLAQTMVAARKALSDSGGNITMRRLNRREYLNTIEHLLGIKADASSLPADGGSGSFDTVGASQFVSSDQIVQYLKLGRSAIDEAFERRAAAGQVTKTFRLEPEDTVNVKSRKIMAKQEKTQKRYLLWKAEIDKVAFLSENEEALAQIREKFKIDDLRNNLRLYQNTELLKGAPDATKFGFLDGNDASFSFQGGYGRTHAYMKHYLELPNSDQGTYLKLTWGIQRIDVVPDPKDVPPGTYKLRIRAGAVESSDSSRHFIEVGHPYHINGQPAGFSGKPLASYQVTGTEDNPEIIETTLVIGSNTPRELGIRERQPEDSKRILRNEFSIYKQRNGYGTPPAIWVDWIELTGPISETADTESRIVRVEPEKTINPANEKEIAQTEERQKRFGLWKKGVDEAAKTAENQAIIAKIRKTDRLIDHPNRFYTFADRLKDTPNPREFGFSDAKKAAASDPSRSRSLALHKHYVGLPHRDRGTYLKLAHGTGRIIVPAKKKELTPGSYIMRVRVGAVEGTPAERRFIQVGPPQRQIESRNWGLEGRAISTHQVTGTIDNPETIEIPLEVTANTIREFAVQEKQPNNGNLKALWDAHNNLKNENGYGHPPAIWIDWVELEGPLNASNNDTRRNDWWIIDPDDAIDPDDSSRAREILQQFAFKAFRGVEAEVEFIDRLTDIFAARRESGDSFETAIRMPLSIILASPSFLYLNEPSNAVGSRQLSDRELAVRLAYFLWSGPPDAELLKLAEQNTLHLQETLRQQVDRMIADPRSDEFVSGFVHQWLDMERLDFFQFDVNLHRDFDESTRAATREEVYQSFAHLLRDSKDGRIGKLLKSDYVFVNGLLATYYGIEGVSGDRFQKIKLPADSPRGGLLGMAAIHAMGSDGIDSSPIERGAWVLRHLLNDPPPPAPPNVPQISRLNDQVLTTRERLLAHQEEAQCASCHRKIDPIGFGLENFNAAGKWRTTDHAGGKGKQGKTWTIDASGAFHKGPNFSDYHELRDLITEREGDFARGLTEHLIEYGLGRPFGFSDEHLADGIVGSAKTKRFSLSEFIHALVQSKAFQTKTSATKNSPGDKQSKFESELFKTGTLVYSDDFDGEFNQQRFGSPKKDKSIKDGKLIVTSLFTSQEEAIAALKRDHHLGLEPVVHLNRIPEQFVCHMRYKFEKKDLTPGRPSFQIGHHMIVLSYLEGGGHRIKLPDGPTYTEPESDMKLNEWIDLIIEYKKGTIRVSVNGCSKTYEHETVTVVNENDKNGPRFSLKGGSDCQIVFDSVRLWECGKKGKQ